MALNFHNDDRAGDFKSRPNVSTNSIISAATLKGFNPRKHFIKERVVDHSVRADCSRPGRAIGADGTPASPGPKGNSPAGRFRRPRSEALPPRFAASTW